MASGLHFTERHLKIASFFRKVDCVDQCVNG